MSAIETALRDIEYLGGQLLMLVVGILTAATHFISYSASLTPPSLFSITHPSRSTKIHLFVVNKTTTMERAELLRRHYCMLSN